MMWAGRISAVMPYVLGGIVEGVRKTTIYLPEGIHRRMGRAAKRLRLSRAEITRAALEEYLDRSERARGLPPSVGMGENPTDRAADYEQRLARGWGRS